jgi:Peptidase propeptide and YPEB domain.
MKKLITVMLLVLSVFGFCACKKEDKSLDLKSNVSFAHTEYYSGENELFHVSVTSGIKENPYIADGVQNGTVDFLEICVVPQKTELSDKTFSYTLYYEGGEVSGELTRDNVKHAYKASVDVGDNRDKLIKLTIAYDDVISEIELTDRLADAISWEQALDMAKTALAAEIEGNLSDEGKLPREICVKFIRDSRNPSSDYFWYVSFVSSEGGYWAVLLEPRTGEVISKKV